jgi:hypothetical protein
LRALHRTGIGVYFDHPAADGGANPEMIARDGRRRVNWHAEGVGPYDCAVSGIDCLEIAVFVGDVGQRGVQRRTKLRDWRRQHRSEGMCHPANTELTGIGGGDRRILGHPGELVVAVESRPVRELRRCLRCGLSRGATGLADRRC